MKVFDYAHAPPSPEGTLTRVYSNGRVRLTFRFGEDGTVIGYQFIQVWPDGMISRLMPRREGWLLENLAQRGLQVTGQ